MWHMCTSIVQGSQACCIKESSIRSHFGSSHWSKVAYAHSLLASWLTLTMAKKSMKKRRTGAANKKRQIANSKAMSSTASDAGMTELASHYAETAQKHMASRAGNFKKKRATFNRVVAAGAQAKKKPKPKPSSSVAKIDCRRIAKLEKTHCGLDKEKGKMEYAVIDEDPEI